MSNREGDSTNCLRIFLGSSRLYLSYYPPKLVTTTRHLGKKVPVGKSGCKTVASLYLPTYYMCNVYLPITLL